jgi:hypothetical protein
MHLREEGELPFKRIVIDIKIHSTAYKENDYLDNGSSL